MGILIIEFAGDIFLGYFKEFLYSKGGELREWLIISIIFLGKHFKN